MWPEAKMKDKEMFTHMNFEFDLGNGAITAETAAKDYHGVPIYSHVYDTNPPVHVTTETGVAVVEVPAPVDTETIGAVPVILEPTVPAVSIVDQMIEDVTSQMPASDKDG